MFRNLLLLSLFTLFSSFFLFSEKPETNFTLYRHATFILNIDNKRILVDPMFGNMGSYSSVKLSSNKLMNPLVDFPVDFKDLINVDGVIITHNHFDHFDDVAKRVLPKDIPLLCQPSDYKAINELGFSNVTKVKDKDSWLGINITRFKGTHGGGIFNLLLGKSSSYLLEYMNYKIFITGDTLLTSTQRKVLEDFNPDYVIAYSGGANIKLGGKLTMGIDDILSISGLLPQTKIIAIHMDSINHCSDTRTKLKKSLSNSHSNIVIPMDYETLSF